MRKSFLTVTLYSYQLRFKECEVFFMDLLKYLEPMKNLPNRFSNLAFRRGVRKLKDEVVSAFEYVDSWGKSIEIKEGELENLINSKSGFAL